MNIGVEYVHYQSLTIIIQFNFSQGDRKEMNENSTNIDLLKSVLAAGLFPQLREIHKKKGNEMFLKDDNGNEIKLAGKYFTHKQFVKFSF